MSYILEALRKMEQHKRRDSKSESWVDELSSESELEKTDSKRQNRLIVAVSIFFGVSGIITGFLFYHGNEVQEKNRTSFVQSEHAAEGLTTPPVARDTNTTPSPVQNKKEPAEKAFPSSLKGVTFSEIISNLSMKEGAADREKPPVKKTTRTLPSVSSLLPKQDTMIDLTGSYRLTSTGKANNRKYATIDRSDYYLGDEFKGMIITGIGKDRVHLKGKERGRRYVIIFRYKKR